VPIRQIHTQNEQHQYCYCGGGLYQTNQPPFCLLTPDATIDRTLTEISLQCDGCKNWFHAKCIQCPLDHVHPFITNYTVREFGAKKKKKKKKKAS